MYLNKPKGVMRCEGMETATYAVPWTGFWKTV